MSFEETIEFIVRRVVREELNGGGVRASTGEPERMRIADVQRRFQVSESWIKARIARGELPVYGRGRMRRLNPDDIRALLQLRDAPKDVPETRAQKILESLSDGNR